MQKNLLFSLYKDSECHQINFFQVSLYFSACRRFFRGGSLLLKQEKSGPILLSSLERWTMKNGLIDIWLRTWLKFWLFLTVGNVFYNSQSWIWSNKPVKANIQVVSFCICNRGCSKAHTELLPQKTFLLGLQCLGWQENPKFLPVSGNVSLSFYFFFCLVLV